MNAYLSWPGQTLELFAAAEDAMRQIPPAFPLDATVAVNPWLGQMGEDRRLAAARLARVGGGRMFLPRDAVARMIAAGDITAADITAAAMAQGFTPEDLHRAAPAAAPAPAVLCTVADLAQKADGVDWPGLVEERISLWAAAQFDRGQAFWPAPDCGIWAAWRGFASHDLTPEIAGLPGFAARVAAMPGDPRAAFAEACSALGLTQEAAPLYFHRLLITLSGWAQYARHLHWTAERDGERDSTLFELLTVRLVWEAVLLESGKAPAPAWEQARAECAMPVQIDRETALDAALQEAHDRSVERRLAAQLAQKAEIGTDTAPTIQAAFCIDVRSERLRRALEASDPQIRTIGFAGFFGLAVGHRGHASDIVEARAPVLLSPGIETRAADAEKSDAAARVRLRTSRAWGRFKRAAVSAFAFVEAAGPLYVGKLLRDGLGLAAPSRRDPPPLLDLPMAERIATAEAVLRAMSLTEGFAPLVLVCGHGAAVTNAPHASALQCGACGGHAGDVNARLLAGLLNETEVRAGLQSKGITIPGGTYFLAGLHDTVSDRVRLFDETLPESHRAEGERLRSALAKAGLLTRTERAQHLPRGVGSGAGPSGPGLVGIAPGMGAGRLPRLCRRAAGADRRAGSGRHGLSA
ncbi:putative inorganic carbon transporter subunit DabA [Sulfitobacter sp. PS-8MA]|uniref:putative inorganic carbon transporter subunit DabA n=1 Tax=Sulfitobacter sp. PS-8MA TaxID=3237707 RepID=UPI0034C676E0